MYIHNCEQQLIQSPYGKDGAALNMQKQSDGTWLYYGSTCIPAPAPAVTIPDVRARLVRLIPGANLALAPSGTTLVNIQTVMWVDALPQRSLGPLAILGHRVAVKLALDHVDYDYGDGATATASTAGKPYDRHADPCKTRLCVGYDGHVYTDTGTQSVAATAAWTATFAVDGGNRVTIPGTVAGPTARTTVTVKQARGVLVPDPSGR